jgi:L-alanine-DL-glutamate epimerase-like enolase superfamily enzyme
MRITEASAELFPWKRLPPLAYGGGIGNASGETDLVVISLATESGLVGHGFLGSPMRPGSLDLATLKRDLLPMLRGIDALHRERFFARASTWARGSFGWRVLGAVDVALWDLAGKAAGLPLHRLLGGARDAIRAYASSPRLADVAAYVAEAKAAQAAGYAGYKLHPPGMASQDIGICEAVRDAVGPGFPLMLDAGFAYRLADAVQVGRAAERLGFLWLEDPLGEHDIAGAATLRRRLGIPVMATEQTPGGLPAYAPWVAAEATDWLRGDTALKGGLTPLVKAAALAEAFGLGFAIHHGGNSLHNLAGLHLALAVPNADWFEVLLPAESHRFGIVAEPMLEAGGLLRPPEGPGLGATVDFSALRSRG